MSKCSLDQEIRDLSGKCGFKYSINMSPVDVPFGAVLGINYSGAHDTAIALVAPDGTPLLAVSLERISRTKQDGRPPNILLQDIPWDRISKVALSVSRSYTPAENSVSKTHCLPIDISLPLNFAHSDVFLKRLEFIPVEKIFVPHHLSHAASTFWGSGYPYATCLVYDGGMFNEEWFGGVYDASITKGIESVDKFAALRYGNIALLYAFVTALLGFTPLKHEGKITGLAAFGRPNANCKKILENWLAHPEDLDGSLAWNDLYDERYAPQLAISPKTLDPIKNSLTGFSKEEVAATIQAITEAHVLDILAQIKKQGWLKDNICLAGGLFANVKVNQRVSEFGFKNVFICPPMTDDGTALGAAWHILSTSREFQPKTIKDVYFGPSYRIDGAELNERGIKFIVPNNPAEYIAEQLAQNLVVAVYQGALEFGPRALGNRSILAPATESSINQNLNQRLSRTEFMPFAPIIRTKDATCYFHIRESERLACQFMTITVKCTARAELECPAVVHVDGTARPQLVERETNALMYDVLSEYCKRTRKMALVNTSFNIHEEPIVCTPEDALRGFFEAGLDVLYIEGKIVKLDENRDVEVRYLRDKISAQSKEIKTLARRAWEERAELNGAYTVGEPVVFNRQFAVNGKRHLLAGWSDLEPLGVWSDRDQAALRVCLGRKFHDGLRLVATVQAFVTERHSHLQVTVIANGEAVACWEFKFGRDDIVQRTAPIPPEVLEKGETLWLDFVIQTPASPLSLGLSADPRMLGIRLQELKLEPLMASPRKAAGRPHAGAPRP